MGWKEVVDMISDWVWGGEADNLGRLKHGTWMDALGSYGSVGELDTQAEATGRQEMAAKGERCQRFLSSARPQKEDKSLLLPIIFCVEDAGSCL